MTVQPIPVSPLAVRRLQLVAAAGAVAFVAGAVFDPRRSWMTLLLVSIYAIGIATGAAAFVAFHYVTGASWSTAVRRIPEALASLIAFGGIGVLLVLLLKSSLYPWSNPSLHDAMPWFRKEWLNAPAVAFRALLFVGGSVAFATALIRHSRAQDGDGDPSRRRSNTTLSAIFLVFFAITTWLASYDWIMSLEPDWASTIFGMYNFAGLFVSALAVITVVTVWLRGRGTMPQVGPAHLHDLGKLLFAFSTFWMYLWFSQYMLIWYANIADETVYYVRRTAGFWAPLFVLNLILNWVVPFFALLPRAAKRSPNVLVKISIVLLLGRWLDLYLMIAPPVVGATPSIGLWEIAITAGAAAAFALLLFSALRRAPLLPQNDAVLPTQASTAHAIVGQ